MTAKLMTTMIHSISDVLETMFFMPADAGESSVFNRSRLFDQSELTAARINYSGALSGSLALIVPTPLLMEMSENFMGESRENLNRELQEGTLKELLNMVCGNALRKWESGAVFELSIPEIISVSDIDPEKQVTLIEVTDTEMAVIVEALKR